MFCGYIITILDKNYIIIYVVLVNIEANLMQQSTLTSSGKSKQLGQLIIENAENIHNLCVQHKDSDLSKSFDGIIGSKSLDIHLSNCDTSSLAFEYSIISNDDKSKVLIIEISVTTFHITINGKFEDVNLEAKPKVNNINDHWHPWYDH